jgi:hypothetical protein
MRQLNRFFILISAAALVACATEAPAPAPAPDSHQLGLVPANATAAKTNPGLNTTGYKRKLVDGQEMFCRNDLVTGSRTEHEGEKCYTADQLREVQAQSQAFLDRVQGQGAMATSTGTPGAGGGR